MRTSSFSNPAVIELLSRSFIPVLVSTDNYDGRLTPTDAREVAGYGNHGQVAVTLLAPDGTVLDAMVVSKALQTERFLIPSLRAVADSGRYKPRAADAVQATKAGPFTPKPKADDAIVLHVWSAGGRDERVAEDWIELQHDEWQTLLPGAVVGSERNVPRPVVATLYRSFYPAVCNYKLANSTLSAGMMEVRTVEVEGTEVRCLIRGAARVKHDVTDTGEFDGRISVVLAGVLRYDSKSGQIVSFKLASERAAYDTRYNGQASGGRMAFAVEFDREAKKASGGR